MNRTHQKWLLALCAAGTAMSLQAATIVRTGRTNPADPPGAGDVTTDETWTNDNVYVLDGIIFVQDGATLTIQPGTLIRGKAEGAGAGGKPGALVVTRGSKIRALGTKNQPIVFTNMNDDHYVGPTPAPGTAPYSTKNNGITETWGGVLVLGKTYIARGPTSPNAGVTLQIEGLVPYGELSKYGGGDDLDDSGVMRFVSIRYGGSVIGEDNEINGLTMGAVGRGTTIEHIEVFQTKDDAFEWFGGTVDVKYLVAWVDGDDGFDWDEGYRGRGQFLLRVQGPLASENDRSDKGAEMDGSTSGDTRMPSSCPMFYNVTMVGHGLGDSPVPAALLKNTALHFRDGGGGRYYNSIFMDFGGAIALVEGDANPANHSTAKMLTYNYGHTKPAAGELPTGNGAASLANYIGYDHGFLAGDKMLDIRNCVFWRFNYPNAFGCPANTTRLAEVFGAEYKAGPPEVRDGDKPHSGFGPYTINSISYGADTGYDIFAAGFGNTLIPKTDPAPVAFLERSATAVVIGGVNYYPITALEPNLPAGSPYLAGGRTPPADGFYTSVAFKGAFEDGRMWAGWTLAARKGLIDWDPLSVIEADYDDPVIESEHLTYTIKFTAEDASIVYTIQWTPTLTPAAWEDIGTVTGVTGEAVFTDTRPLAGSGFYRVRE